MDAVTLLALWLALTAIRSMLLIWLPSASRFLEEVSFSLHAWMAMVLVPVWSWQLMHTAGDASLRQHPNLAAIARSCGLAMLVSLGIFFAIHVTDFLSRSLVFAFALLSVPSIYLSRQFLRQAITVGWLEEQPLNLLFIGPADTSLALFHRIGGRALGRLSVSSTDTKGPITVLGDLSALGDVLTGHPVDRVLLTQRDLPTSLLRQIVRHCEDVGVPFSMDAQFLDQHLAKARLEAVEDAELLTFTTLPHSPGALAIKRMIDVLVAAVLLVLLAPVMVPIVLLIWREDHGPVLFQQERVGRFGRRFTMLKFRSMYVDAEQRFAEVEDLNEADGPIFKMEHDPRVTRIGHLLRRSSLDELPQLWNVLRGEMSLVGPRPPLPREVQNYETWQRRRLSMKPGLTCIWQVSGRSRLDFETWMRLDLEYIDNWSLGLDLRLLLRTVPAVLSGDGAR